MFGLSFERLFFTLNKEKKLNISRNDYNTKARHFFARIYIGINGIVLSNITQRGIMTKQITTRIEFVLGSIFVLAEKSTNSHRKYIRERKEKTPEERGKHIS